jgi:hypothetical protein
MTMTVAGDNLNNKLAMPAWAGAGLRLDPYRLPHKISHERQDSSWSIDRHGVVLKRRLPQSGLPVAVALPAKCFKGVAARAMENADGTTTVTLELHHQDAALCVPLLVASDFDDIAADWHSWSRLMRLPMLIAGDQGEMSPVRKLLGEIMVDPTLERRKRLGALKHRPWFLRRRKAGVIGPVVRISGEEIIARN